MFQKIFTKLLLMAILLVAFYPSGLKAQIFTGAVGCVSNEDCPTNYNCDTDLERCVPTINCANDPPYCPDGYVCDRTLDLCVKPEAQQGAERIGEVLSPTGVAGTADFSDLILKYVNFALPFLALAAFAGFVYAGFLYVTAYGNDEQLQKAKKILIYAVVGLVLVILSFSIVQLFTGGLVDFINR